MINQFSKIHLEKEEEKIKKNLQIENCNDSIFLGIVGQKIGLEEPIIAYEKRQSSNFREITSIHHWHTPSKSDMSLE